MVYSKEHLVVLAYLATRRTGEPTASKQCGHSADEEIVQSLCYETITTTVATTRSESVTKFLTEKHYIGSEFVR